MTGNDALYLNVRKKDTPNDDRAILMTGKNARYMEFTPNTEEEIRTAVYNQLIRRRCKHDDAIRLADDFATHPETRQGIIDEWKLTVEF